MGMRDRRTGIFSLKGRVLPLVIYLTSVPVRLKNLVAGQARQRMVKGGILALIGYLLSPLSWWNDIVVNIPIAYGFAFLISLISESWFFPAMVAGYWLTNIAGLVLLHKGIAIAVRKEDKKGAGYGWKQLLKDLGLSIGYTMLIVVLIWLNILRLPIEYFPNRS